MDYQTEAEVTQEAINEDKVLQDDAAREVEKEVEEVLSDSGSPEAKAVISEEAGAPQPVPPITKRGTGLIKGLSAGEYKKKWLRDHPERVKEYRERFLSNHPEYGKGRAKKVAQPELPFKEVDNEDTVGE
jgi:hypothetical protein